MFRIIGLTVKLLNLVQKPPHCVVNLGFGAKITTQIPFLPHKLLELGYEMVCL